MEMKRKALGIMLLLILLPAFMACQNVTTTATTLPNTQSTITTTEEITAGHIGLELYDGDGVLVSRKVVAYDESDTLLGLLRENYTVYCQGSDGNPDDSCSFETDYGYYVMGIDTVQAFGSNEYIAFYIEGQYAMTGIGDTPITDQYCYQFKLETF